MNAQQPVALLTALEAWYRRHARALPWRIGPAARDAGQSPDPYAVWLSEVMLQQTTAPHAAPYYLRFLEVWPTVGDLAAASWDDVSAAWAGLGYYSRARSLHACARQVAAEGGFPQDRAALLALPGVGPYTASAISAIAFDQPFAPVDGNIERVVSRLYAIPSDRTEAGWRTAKKIVAARAQEMFDALSGWRAGDLAQALMDLGATVCTPRKPACGSCPLSHGCAAYAEGAPERYPMKPDKKVRPARTGAAFVAVRDIVPGGIEVLLQRRPPEGLLGGMLMPPTSAWVEAGAASSDALSAAPLALPWKQSGEVTHVFTHFSLTLTVWRALTAATDAPAGAVWVAAADALASLPTVGRKAVKLALDQHAAARS